MKRLCIFSFYDKDGFVDDYVFYLLKQIKVNTVSLIIVVNGFIQDCFTGELDGIADSVIYRENKGFDAGAYKYVIVHRLKKEDLYKYDEVILCNNTFYGPFVSLDHIFDVMGKKNNDLWGVNLISPTVVDHIQSYFLVFRENIIKSGLLYDFFRDHIDEYDADIVNVYIEFETGITQFFIKHGFSIGSYAVPNICDIYRSCNYGIKSYGIPIIKNKIALDNNTMQDNFIDAVQYVEQNTTYDVNLIESHIKRVSVSDIDYNKPHLDTKEYLLSEVNNSIEMIQGFAQKFSSIYIYGAGLIARKVYSFYNLNNVKGFIISDGQEKKYDELYGLPVLLNSQVNDIENIGIVVAMKLSNLQQIKSDIAKFDNVVYL